MIVECLMDRSGCGAGAGRAAGQGWGGADARECVRLRSRENRGGERWAASTSRGQAGGATLPSLGDGGGGRDGDVEGGGALPLGGDSLGLRGLRSRSHRTLRATAAARR